MKMPPASPANSMSDGSGRNAVLGSKRLNRLAAAGLAAKRHHERVGETGPRAVLATEPAHQAAGACVSLILGVRNPFQIRRRVVGLDAVDVVHLCRPGGTLDKRLRHKPVDETQGFRPATAKPNKQIPSLCAYGAMDVPDATSPLPPGDATHSAVIGHLVGREVGDRLPRFRRRWLMGSHGRSISNQWAQREGKPKPWLKGGVPA